MANPMGLGGSGLVPPAAARSQEGPAAMGAASAPPRRFLVFVLSAPAPVEGPVGDAGTVPPAIGPAPAPPGRNTSLQKIGEVIESTGECLGRWYAPLANTRDFFTQVGKFVPDEELKAACPSLLIRVATVCKRIGAEIGNVTMCVQGVAGVCSLMGAAVRRLNLHQPQAPVYPQTVTFTTLEELETIITNWRKTEGESPPVIDIEESASVVFAKRVEYLLSKHGNEVMALMEKSPTYQARLAQFRKGLELQAALGPKGVKEILVEYYSRTPTTPPATLGEPSASPSPTPTSTTPA